FYARQFSVPWVGGEGAKLMTKVLRGDEFEAAWPTNGPGDIGGDFDVIPAFGLPAINTAILLTSCVTITITDHAIKAGNRAVLNTFLGLTLLLGYVFVFLQATEYIEAYQHYNLKMTSGIYGSTFFMLTGFHGFHVTVGAIMLTVIWLRCLKGHFTPTQHF